MKRLIVNRRRLMSVAVVCAFFGAHHSHAQLYKWVDENGKTQYSDTIPPTSTDRARKELRADGTVKSSTERAATAEEKRLAAIKAVDDAKLKLLHDERDRKDKALLLTYSNLADFDRVRDRALAALTNDIRNLSERESVLQQTINANGVVPPSALIAATAAAPISTATTAAASPAAAGKAPNTASTTASATAAASAASLAKALPPKPANVVLLEAKAELPRVTEAVQRKRRDLDGLTAVYTADRSRLAVLIEAEKAKLDESLGVTTPGKPAAGKAAAASISVVVPTPGSAPQATPVPAAAKK
jgi:Domain of unknown function (DUF4124)